MVRLESNRVNGRRRGSVLVEFALVSLVLYLILAATLEFGRALFAAQILQQAADVAAREVSRTAGLGPTGTLTNWDDPDDKNAAFNNNNLKKTIYDEQFTVVHPIPSNGLDYFNHAPILNRLLAPLMIRDPDRDLLYYPGQLVRDDLMSSGYHVEIPIVGYGRDGSETIVKRVRIVEEIPYVSPSDPNQTPQSMFGLTSTDSPYPPPANMLGLVALRINYPFQSAMLTAYAPSDSLAGPPTNIPINAPSLDIIRQYDEATGQYTQMGEQPGAYAGAEEDGLGKLFAYNNTRNPNHVVRAFRRVISTQAIYRRELY